MRRRPAPRATRAAGVVVAAVLLAAPMALPAASAPASEPGGRNDLYAAAATLDGLDGRVATSNVGASVEYGERDPLQQASHSVWFTWQAPAAGPVRFDTAGSAIDTVLGVYTGDTLTDLDVVGVNDDNGHPTAAAVAFEARAGQTYRLQVDGADGQTGDIVLTWAPAVATGPANDDLATATSVQGDRGQVTGSNVGATVEIDEPDPAGQASHSVWWTWTPDTSDLVRLETAGSTFDTVLSVYTGDGYGDLIEEAANDDAGSGTTSAVTMRVDAGRTYHLRVDGVDGQTGEVALAWQPAETRPSRSPQSARTVQSTVATIPATADTGEKPQSKLWKHDGRWFAVLPAEMPEGEGTWLWRLDAGGWTNILLLDGATNTQADTVKRGDVTHVLLWEGSSSSRLVSLEYTGTGSYGLWSQRPSTTVVSTTDSEITTIDVDSTGRMWLATDASGDVHVHHSAPPYTGFSGPISLASGIAGDDIAMVTRVGTDQIGVLWSNQNSERFGFRIRSDGAAVSSWGADEVPASQSALDQGGGMADDHLNAAVAPDGTLYAAIKTSYDSSGFTELGLLVRRPNGTWDDLHEADTDGTRPIVVVGAADDTVRYFYNHGGNCDGDIAMRTSPLGTVGFGGAETVLSGDFCNVTSTKDTFTSDLVVMAASDDVAHHAMLGGGGEPPPPPPPPPDEQGTLDGHWQVNEGGGTTVVDSSSRGNDGTVSGAPAWVDGVDALALEMTSDDSVLVPDAPSLDMEGPITLAGWVRPQEQGAQSVIRKGVHGSVDGYELSLSSDGRAFLRFNEASSGNTYRILSTSTVPADGTTWTHLAGTFDGSTMRLYVDGREEASGPGPGTIATNDQPLGLGNDSSADRGFEGALDELRVYSYALTAAAVDGLVVDPGGVAPPAGQATIDRLSGADRIETAAAVSAATFSRATTVVLARADTYPDALAGAPLAASFGGPMLLTSSAGLSPPAREEITRLGARRVVMLGGEDALSAQVRNDVLELGLDVDRVGGQDRFETARQVARAVGGDTVYVTEGAHADPTRGWPDAVSVSGLAAYERRPILLVTRDHAPPATTAALADLGAQQATIVGGIAAVSAAVAESLEAAGVTVERVEGADRFETSRRIADRAAAAGMSSTRPWVATGLDFPDALVAGPSVAANTGNLLLVHGQTLAKSPASHEWIQAHASGFVRVAVLGGEQAVSQTVVDEIQAALTAADR